MDLTDLLAERAVLFCTGVQSKKQLFTTLSERASEVTGLAADDIYSAILGREELGSTGLGNGIAIPHGKVAGLRHVTAVFASLDKPIDFDAVDDEPVDIVMMLLAPAGAGADHLKALSLVARLLRTDSVVERLRSLSDPRRLYETLINPVPTHDAA
jgi:nitrogen PTS system EIIA component